MKIDTVIALWELVDKLFWFDLESRLWVIRSPDGCITTEGMYEFVMGADDEDLEGKRETVDRILEQLELMGCVERIKGTPGGSSRGREVGSPVDRIENQTGNPPTIHYRMDVPGGSKLWWPDSPTYHAQRQDEDG